MTVKIRLDGVDFEASEQLSQAFSAYQQKQQERIDALETQVKEHGTEVEKLKARADTAEEKAAAAEKAREDALKPEEIRKRVDARITLERTAAKVLGEKDEAGKEIKLDAMSDEEIRKAVVLKVFPSAKERLDGASEEYLAARFDSAVESFSEEGGAQKRNDGLGALRTSVAHSVSREDTAEKVGKARQDICDQWKQPLAASKDARN